VATTLAPSFTSRTGWSQGSGKKQCQVLEPGGGVQGQEDLPLVTGRNSKDAGWAWSLQQNAPDISTVWSAYLGLDAGHATRGYGNLKGHRPYVVKRMIQLQP
jgi:hypothetical protein